MTPRLVITLRIEQTAGQAANDAAQAARSAEQARASADRIIENAIQEAERATNAAQPASPAPPPPVPGTTQAPGSGPIIFTDDNGRPVSIKMQDGNLVLTQEGNTQVIPFRDVVPREAVQIAWSIPATLSILLIWWPLSRAVIRWLNRKHVANTETAAVEARLQGRMDTLERNLDTVAVEMERLSEGQRFTNKLLAQRAEGDTVPASAER